MSETVRTIGILIPMEMTQEKILKLCATPDEDYIPDDIPELKN